MMAGGIVGVLMLMGLGALAQDAEVKIPDKPEEYFPMTVGSEWVHDLRIAREPREFHEARDTFSASEPGLPPGQGQVTYRVVGPAIGGNKGYRIEYRDTVSFGLKFTEELVFALGVGLISAVQRSEEDAEKGEITYEMRPASYRIAEPQG